MTTRQDNRGPVFAKLTNAYVKAHSKSKLVLVRPKPQSRAIDTRRDRQQKIKRSITLAKHA